MCHLLGENGRAGYLISERGTFGLDQIFLVELLGINGGRIQRKGLGIHAIPLCIFIE